MPHGHGFIAATSVNRAGNVAARPTRTTATLPSSSGWRSASSTSRPNSGSSSQTRTPWSASVTSPGDIRGPPPTIPAYDTVWWGARTGGRRTSARTGSPAATDATTVAASAASSSRSGSRPGIVRASSVLPAPGGPTSSIAWPPASAISSARRATRLAAHLREVDRRLPPADAARTHAARARRPRRSAASASARGSGTGTAPGARAPARASAASAIVATPTASSPGTSRASASAAAGTRTRRTPAAASARPIGRTPGTAPDLAAERPARRSAPTRPRATRSCSDPSRIPIAIARSSDAPALRSSAGARLTVIRRGGWW